MRVYCQHCEQQCRRGGVQQDGRVDRHRQLAARSARRLGVAERVLRPQAAGTLQHNELRLLLARWHVCCHRWRRRKGSMLHIFVYTSSEVKIKISTRVDRD